MNHTVTLKDGTVVPALGLGTWYLGDSRAVRAQEIEALRAGVDAGMTLIDTAEMYGGGRSENLVGEAIRPYDREKLFLVSKVLPQNAGKRRMEASLDASLKRLGTDYLDLYLYHWRGSIPLRETVSELERLKKTGKILRWGVSNLDIDEMEEIVSLPGGKNCMVDQVLYHLGSRGIEYSLLPWMREQNITLMAYCPLAQAGSLKRGMMSNPVVKKLAEEKGATPEQIILAWDIRDGHTIAIPRSGVAEHVRENAAADRICLTEQELSLLDGQFAPPSYKEYLDMQ